VACTAAKTRTACPSRVKLGGQGRSATRLVVPNKQTSAGVGGRSLQCQQETHALQQATPHSITSSARPSTIEGMVRPSAFAVTKLMTSSNLVGCSTGRSLGFAPRRILST